MSSDADSLRLGGGRPGVPSKDGRELIAVRRRPRRVPRRRWRDIPFCSILAAMPADAVGAERESGSLASDTFARASVTGGAARA